jgi:hypothetical protein
MTSNNAAALLLPDQETLVQFQPLVRCTPGGPLFSLPSWRDDTMFNGTAWVPQPGPQNQSILGNGIWGAHGDSRLSSIGGTIRLGELLPSSPPIAHAIKLMLWGQDYYFPGNNTVPCYRWPALNCDGSWNASTDPTNGNYYNGTNIKLKPGALLAIPSWDSAKLQKNITTMIGQKLLDVLTHYGGYLDDNTAHDRGAFNVEGGVRKEVQSHYEGLDLSNIVPGQSLYQDLVVIYRNLQVVDNNSEDQIGGGGTPCRKPLPPICPVAVR